MAAVNDKRASKRRHRLFRRSDGTLNLLFFIFHQLLLNLSSYI
jgi:hypothetical protein